MSRTLFCAKKQKTVFHIVHYNQCLVKYGIRKKRILLLSVFLIHMAAPEYLNEAVKVLLYQNIGTSDYRGKTFC